MTHWLGGTLSAHPPLEGEGRPRANASGRGGVNQTSPHPGSTLPRLADPPPPGQGEARMRQGTVK
jgi:hypothetical protein